MSVLRVAPGLPAWAVACETAGRGLVKAAADDAEVAYNLVGQLYLSPSGWLLLSVPNPLVRGVFAAMHEPGLELPPGPGGGPMNAHISVMRPTELTQLGGPDKVTERGKQFHYTLGRLYAIDPAGFQDVSRAWIIRVHSPELQALRRSYGLSSLPNDGAYDFHITVGVVKRGVLGRNEVMKGDAPAPAGEGGDEGRGTRVLVKH